MSVEIDKALSGPPAIPAAPKITVAGVTFSEAEVVSAVVKIDGREIVINPKDDPKRIGFAK